MLFLLFQLDAERFALPAREVQEVLPLVATTTLPGAPGGIVGLFNYRGQAVPVLDLALRLLGRPSARRVSTRLVIVNRPGTGAEGQLLGLIVERATGTVAKEPGEFRPVGVTGPGTSHLGPVAQDPDGLIQQLDLAGLLAGSGTKGGPGAAATVS